MKTNVKPLVAILLSLVMIMSFSLAGCGSSDNGSDGKTFTVAVTQEIDSLNPLSAWLEVSHEALLLMYDPLVRYDKNLEPEPCLAESWEVSPDQLTWTFHLVKDVKWSDGEPFTSKDVKFTYEFYKENDSYLYSSYLSDMDNIKCPDDNTLVIVTKEPKANMLMNTSPIVPEHIWKDVKDPYNWANAKPVGTGPYNFAQKEEGFLKLSKNPNYFGTKATVENIVFALYENTDTAAQALMLGEIDGAISLSAPQIEQLKKEDNISVIQQQVPGFSMLSINMSAADKGGNGNPLLRDKAVREAIEYCTDRGKIVDMIYGGAALKGSTFINPDTTYAYKVPEQDLRNYNTKKAAAILEKAGYKDTNGDGIREDSNGKKLSFKLAAISDNTEEVKTGSMIASGCKDAGIEVKIVTMDSGALYDDVAAYNYDLYITGWGADVDPSAIAAIFTSDELGNLNDSGYSNTKYDNLFKKQQTIMDEKKRVAMVQEMQKMVYDDVPYVIYAYDNYIQAIRTDRWTGFEQIPTSTGGYFINLTDLNYINLKPAK